VGRQVAAAISPRDDPGARVAAAAEALRGLGGDVEVQETADGWRLQGYGCPLSAVTARRPEVCALAQALVEEITGRPVAERCDREGRPRCGFLVRTESPTPAFLERH
jgi:predicted ArsR family transcriptional regulator